MAAFHPRSGQIVVNTCLALNNTYSIPLWLVQHVKGDRWKVLECLNVWRWYCRHKPAASPTWSSWTSSSYKWCLFFSLHAAAPILDSFSLKGAIYVVNKQGMGAETSGWSIHHFRLWRVAFFVIFLPLISASTQSDQSLIKSQILEPLIKATTTETRLSSCPMWPLANQSKQPWIAIWWN